MNPFQSLRDYELLIYTLPQTYPYILRSTLIVAQRKRTVATVTGELLWATGHRLTVAEIVTWDIGPVVIQQYSYEGWLGSEKLYWYDSQAHPNDPTLASTHPHHKHIPPDIKHNRVPAPGLSFTQPNLPLLIEEVEGRFSTNPSTTTA